MLCYNNETTTGKRSSIYPMTLQLCGSKLSFLSRQLNSTQCKGTLWRLGMRELRSPTMISNSTDHSERHHLLGIPDSVLKLAHPLKPVQEKGKCALGEMYPQRELKNEMMLSILEVESRRQQVPPIPVSWTHGQGFPVQSTLSAANDLNALRKWQWCVPVVTGLVVFASVCACAGVCMGRGTLALTVLWTKYLLSKILPHPEFSQTVVGSSYLTPFGKQVSSHYEYNF